MYTYEFLYFRSYHPYVDGEKTLQDHLIKYDEMVVTKVVHALTFLYVQANRQMMQPYLSFYFGACCDLWKTKERPSWLLMRDTSDEHGESVAGQSAAGFGEPPPPPKGLACGTRRRCCMLYRNGTHGLLDDRDRFVCDSLLRGMRRAKLGRRSGAQVAPSRVARPLFSIVRDQKAGSFVRAPRAPD